MLKYFDAKDKYVVDEPSLWTVNGSVDIQYAGGTEHKDGEFTIQVGNIESYNPTELDQEPVPEIIPNPSGGGNSGGSEQGSGDNPGGNEGQDPIPTGNHDVISFGVNITNAHGSAIELVGEIVFILGNPDHNGNYFGNYTGRYVRTDHITFSSPVTLAAGETKSFDNISWRDSDTGLGMGGTSPLDPSLLTDIGRRSNVLLYVLEQDGTKNSEIVICDPMDKNIIFQNGQIYSITFR